MNKSIIVYIAFIALIMYFNGHVVELFTGKTRGYDYRDFLCVSRKSDKDNNCNSIININQRSLSMNPGNFREKVFYDF
jgi:hypothetical protein